MIILNYSAICYDFWTHLDNEFWRLDTYQSPALASGRPHIQSGSAGPRGVMNSISEVFKPRTYQISNARKWQTHVSISAHRGLNKSSVKTWCLKKYLRKKKRPTGPCGHCRVEEKRLLKRTVVRSSMESEQMQFNLRTSISWRLRERNMLRFIFQVSICWWLRKSSFLLFIFQMSILQWLMESICWLFFKFRSPF